MGTSTAESRLVAATNEGLPGDLTAADKGRVLHNRRLAARIKSPNALAELMRAAGHKIHRDTVLKAERGDPTVLPDTYERISSFLDDYTGEPVTPPGEMTLEQIEFTVEGDFGVRVTVKGPIADHETLREDVAAIIRSIRAGDPHPSDGD